MVIKELIRFKKSMVSFNSKIILLICSLNKYSLNYLKKDYI
mgnify:CR=1 FL=1